jgi:hypothetical protein
MNVVVDDRVAVLQVLPFGNVVGADQNIDRARFVGKDGRFLFSIAARRALAGIESHSESSVLTWVDRCQSLCRGVGDASSLPGCHLRGMFAIQEVLR